MGCFMYKGVIVMYIKRSFYVLFVVKSFTSAVLI